MKEKPSHIQPSPHSSSFDHCQVELVKYGTECLSVQEALIGIARSHGIAPETPGAKQMLARISLSVLRHFRKGGK